MIIDAHIHLSESGRWLAPLSAKQDLSLGSVLKEMDSAGLTRAVVLSLQGFNDNMALHKMLTKHFDRFIMFGCFDPESREYPREIEILAKDYGFQGLKIHPRRQGISPLDRRLDPGYEKAAALGLPVVFDAYPQSQQMPLHELRPYVYDRLAKRHPHLKIIMAHAGAHRLWDAYFVARSNPNVYLDLSYILKIFSRTSLMSDLAVIMEQLDRKIIYGSDFPEVSLKDYLDSAKALMAGLPKEKRENILSGNIINLLRPPG